MMTQIHTSRKSANPYIETIWKTRNVSDGVYMATPDGSWDLIVMIAADGSRQMMLAGQATKTQSVPYEAGSGGMVISFAPGAYLVGYDLSKIVDSGVMLPNAGDDHFEFLGHVFAFPEFDDAEKLVDELVTLGILKNDRVVDGVLQGAPPAMSDRARQRHFAKTTGLTQKSFTQIARAKQAVTLLKQGKKPADVAADLGYTDQAHMAKSIKKLMGTTPTDIGHIHKL
jgi:hypothetical protein